MLALNEDEGTAQKMSHRSYTPGLSSSEETHFEQRGRIAALPAQQEGDCRSPPWLTHIWIVDRLDGSHPSVMPKNLDAAPVPLSQALIAGNLTICLVPGDLFGKAVQVDVPQPSMSR